MKLHVPQYFMVRERSQRPRTGYCPNLRHSWKNTYIEGILVLTFKFLIVGYACSPRRFIPDNRVNIYQISGSVNYVLYQPLCIVWAASIGYARKISLCRTACRSEFRGKCLYDHMSTDQWCAVCIICFTITTWFGSILRAARCVGYNGKWDLS